VPSYGAVPGQEPAPPPNYDQGPGPAPGFNPMQSVAGGYAPPVELQGTSDGPPPPGP
jgi:hypothetical protein